MHAYMLQRKCDLTQTRSDARAAMRPPLSHNYAAIFKQNSTTIASVQSELEFLPILDAYFHATVASQLADLCVQDVATYSYNCARV